MWPAVMFIFSLFAPITSSLPTMTTTTARADEEMVFDDSTSILNRPLSLISPKIVDLGELKNNPQLLAKRSAMMQRHRRQLASATNVMLKNSERNANRDENKEDDYVDNHGDIAKVGAALTALYTIDKEEKEIRGMENSADSDVHWNRCDLSSGSLVEAAASLLGLKILDGHINIDIV
eukprot:9622152-Ditylum_brightwellii.AAC.1